MARKRDRRRHPVDLGAREHYEDAALYDYEYRRRRQDVTFYRQLAREVGGESTRVLELACGSGRLTTALARDGHEVVGMDLSDAMLARAAARLDRLPRAVRERVKLVRADMRSFAFAARFPLVLSAFNSLEHLYTRVEMAACLSRVAEHLEPDGRFAFDVQVPNLPWLARDPTKRWARTTFRHPTTGRRVVYSTNHEYDEISQIVLIRLYYEPPAGEAGPRRVVTLSQRKFFPAELEALVAASPLSVERRHGDFDGGPLTGDAESQVLVCKLRSPPTGRHGPTVGD